MIIQILLQISQISCEQNHYCWKKVRYEKQFHLWNKDKCDTCLKKTFCGNGDGKCCFQQGRQSGKKIDVDDWEGGKEQKHREIQKPDCYEYLQTASHLGYPRKHLGNLKTVNVKSHNVGYLKPTAMTVEMIWFQPHYTSRAAASIFNHTASSFQSRNKPGMLLAVILCDVSQVIWCGNCTLAK